MICNVSRIKQKEDEFLNEFLDEEAMPNDLLDKSMDINNKYSKLLIEITARNLVAWSTSKDKREGMLPEVYLDNKHIYEKLTGKKFVLSEVKAKYY